jgi:hypothetical protein
MEKGSYTGSLSKSFKINPRAPKITSLKAMKKGFIIKWKKQTAKESSGYQVQWSRTYKTVWKRITILPGLPQRK